MRPAGSTGTAWVYSGARSSRLITEPHRRIACSASARPAAPGHTRPDRKSAPVGRSTRPARLVTKFPLVFAVGPRRVVAQQAMFLQPGDQRQERQPDRLGMQPVAKCLAGSAQQVGSLGQTVATSSRLARATRGGRAAEPAQDHRVEFPESTTPGAPRRTARPRS